MKYLRLYMCDKYSNNAFGWTMCKMFYKKQPNAVKNICTKCREDNEM